MKYLLALSAVMILSAPVFADSHAEKKSMETKMEAKAELVKKVSPYSVNETMDKFETIIKKKNFDVFARIDHQKNAKGAELEMAAAQVIIFGNPKGGTMLMNDDIGVSLDLPLRVAVYQGKDDKVYIVYREPVAMVKDYDLAGHKVVGALTEGLSKLTSAAIAKP